MPYINPEHRKHFDKLVEELVFELDEFEEAYERPGAVNYVITRIVAKSLTSKHYLGYHSLSRALAVFHDAEAEMRRRLLDPYEDKKIIENGDIPEYEPS